MANILFYRLAAYDHKDNVNQIQQDFNQLLTTMQPYPIINLLRLIPLQFGSINALLDRKQISSPANGTLSCPYRETQYIQLGDPALGNMYLSIPAVCEATANRTDSYLSLTLSPGFVLQINKLTEGGLNRSAFQNIRAIIFEPNVCTTVLEDQNDRNKITHLVVYLDRTVVNTKDYEQHYKAANEVELEKVSVISNLDAKCCEGVSIGYGEPETYYVMHRNGHPGICDIRTTRVIGPSEWTIIGAFDTEKEAIEFESKHPLCNVNIKDNSDQKH